MKIKVGIVEDDRAARENWVKILNAHPKLTCVAACATGEEALKILPDCRPDVVLMDINLPGMTGIQCTARIKKGLPNTLILMVTAFSNNDYIFEALQAGASGYLLKSKSSEEVVHSILDVMEGGAPMTGQIARRVIEVFRKPAPKGLTEAELTIRENEILQWIAKGLSNKEIAVKIDTTIYTVRKHVEHIYEKLHVHCRTEAAAKYLGGADKATAHQTAG
ncbi:MAG: response regulator transcription factor [Verrucomicrobiota bacterium]